MLEEGILAGVLLLFIFLLCFASRKLWRFWSQYHCANAPTNDMSQPLVTPIDEDGLLTVSPAEHIDVDESPSLGLEVGKTLKRRALPILQRQDSNRRKVSEVSKSGLLVDQEKQQSQFGGRVSALTLKVISGPSIGTVISHVSGQHLTIGRVATNNLVLNDPEVSGKHASIRWNPKLLVWELVDLGSLNGTHVNNQSVPVDQLNGGTKRKSSIPIELANGDIILLGSSSQILVHICDDINESTTDLHVASCPFDVGVAADPMALRRGGKRLPMEDVCIYEWPLRGLKEFGIFCIFDGHGGGSAAIAASQIMPQKLCDILKVDAKRAEVMDSLDAADVLRTAFSETESALDHQYEGCTATVLLLWLGSSSIYAQCANVGDSACIFSIGERSITMTEDHRLTSFSERSRMLEMGVQLREGETRLCGMNIARALGDKFLKEQDARFSSTPFVSEVIEITPESKALAVMASDGLWDVLSQRRALQLGIEARDGQYQADGTVIGPHNAKSIAEMLVNKARSLRTKDNTTVIVLDFVSYPKSQVKV